MSRIAAANGDQVGDSRGSARAGLDTGAVPRAAPLRRRQIRRVLDLDHESKLSQFEAASAALDLRAEVSV